MTVADLQKHLGDLAAFLEVVKASTAAKDLRSARDALCPFAQKTVKDFADFLVRADEFVRTGKLQSPTRTRAAPRPKPTAASNAAELAAETRRLYDRAADPSVSASEIGAMVARLGHLQQTGLVSVAEALGLKGMKSKKKDKILAEIRRMIEGRRESLQRVNMLHPVGEPGPDGKSTAFPG